MGEILEDRRPLGSDVFASFLEDKNLKMGLTRMALDPNGAIDAVMRRFGFAVLRASLIG